MGTPTYSLIQEQVLGSASAAVTFSSIPQTYKDLVLEVLYVDGSSAGSNYNVQVNGDTGGNYSWTWLQGNGSAAASGRNTNQTFALVATSGGGKTTKVGLTSFMSYSNTTTYKTILSRFNDSTYNVDATVSLWRNTAAITSIKALSADASGFGTGSALRLWGVIG